VIEVSSFKDRNAAELFLGFCIGTVGRRDFAVFPVQGQRGVSCSVLVGLPHGACGYPPLLILICHPSHSYAPARSAPGRTRGLTHYFFVVVHVSAIFLTLDTSNFTDCEEVPEDAVEVEDEALIPAFELPDSFPVICTSCPTCSLSFEVSPSS